MTPNYETANEACAPERDEERISECNVCAFINRWKQHENSYARIQRCAHLGDQRVRYWEEADGCYTICGPGEHEGACEGVLVIHRDEADAEFERRELEMLGREACDAT